MVRNYLIKEEDNKLFYQDVLLLDDEEAMKHISHPIRIKILKELSKSQEYPSKLAERIGIHEQNVYYHIKQLLKAGVIEVASKEEIRGTVARRFTPKNMSFALSLEDKWKPFQKQFTNEIHESVLTFFDPLIKNNGLKGKVVVGSPDPHGPLKASARDGHYAIDLGIFLGRLVDMPDDFSVKLDVDIKSQKETGKNLLVLGGPVTNLLVSELNDCLAIRFTDSAPYGLYSEKTGKRYWEDSIGLIARIRNPFNPERIIYIIAGIRSVGTKSAVIALTRHHNYILQNFDPSKDWYCVVRGFDMDGDGQIDSVEVLE